MHTAGFPNSRPGSPQSTEFKSPTSPLLDKIDPFLPEIKRKKSPPHKVPPRPSSLGLSDKLFISPHFRVPSANMFEPFFGHTDRHAMGGTNNNHLVQLNVSLNHNVHDVVTRLVGLRNVHDVMTFAN